MVTATATITMSMREADRLKTIQAVVDRMLRVGQAAQRLDMSRRQIERLVSRYRTTGRPALSHASAGVPAIASWPQGLPSAPSSSYASAMPTSVRRLHASIWRIATVSACHVRRCGR